MALRDVVGYVDIGVLFRSYVGNGTFRWGYAGIGAAGIGAFRWGYAGGNAFRWFWGVDGTSGF